MRHRKGKQKAKAIINWQKKKKKKKKTKKTLTDFHDSASFFSTAATVNAPNIARICGGFRKKIHIYKKSENTFR